MAAGTVNSAGTVECAYFAPTPRTPATGALAVTERVRFTWEGVEGASAYRIRVSASEDLADPLIDETTAETSHTPAGLENDQTYYWQLAALDAYGHHGSTGAVLSFAATARIRLVKDLTPRRSSSSPENLTVVGDRLFFSALNTAKENQAEYLGRELWMTDGTPSGTVLLKDLDPGPGSGAPEGLTDLSGYLFFLANGSELWRVPTFNDTTKLVGHMDSLDHADSRLVEAAAVGGNLFLTIFNGADNRYELLCSYSLQPVLLRDVDADNLPDERLHLTDVDGSLFFTAFDDTHGLELWKSDGTATGTVLVKDIFPDSGCSSPSDLTAVGDTLYFVADDGSYDSGELWKSDGTEMGTVLVKEYCSETFIYGSSYSIDNLVSLDGKLYFSADDGVTGDELWQSDGTAEGTLMVEEINLSGQNDTGPYGFTVGNGKLFFCAHHPDSGYELWQSDATAAGTGLVKDIFPGVDSAYFLPLFVGPDGVLLFTIDDGSGSGYELWRSDGTVEGTMMVKDIYPGIQGSYPEEFVSMDTGVFFIADDGVNGKGLWRTDGSASGTERIMGFQDGSRHHLAKAGDTLFICLRDADADQLQLWRSDGTSDNTMKVTDIAFDISGTEHPYPSVRESLAIGDTLFFVTRVSNSNSSYRLELWQSDGTSGGTTRIKKLASAWDNSTTVELTQFKGKLYFTAHDEATGWELWMTDGTPASTVLVMDIHTGDIGSDPAHLAVLGDGLYFSADDGVNGRELWMTDGTETTMVKDILAGPTGSGVKNLFSLNDTLFFQADDGIHGRELWESDGTAAGTRLAADINPGANHGEPSDFIEYNDMLLFSAYDREHGLELWRCIP